MLTAGKTGLIAITIAGAGIALGAVLGDAVDPDMKPPPEAAWRDRFHAHYDAAAGYEPVVSEPQVVPFYGFPSEADAAIAAEWSEDSDAWLDEWDGETLDAESYSAPAYGDRVIAGNAYAGYEPFPPSNEADQAGAAAEYAAEDAERAAAEPRPAEPPAPGGGGLPALW